MVGISLSMETSCGAMLRELQYIWADIGESQADKDRTLSEIEEECLQVYRRKVDEASDAKARLHQSLAAKEAELSVLMASLGEHNLHSKTDKRLASLKEQLALVTPLLEDMRKKKEERVKQFTEVCSQIEKITSEMTEFNQKNATTNSVAIEEHDLSVRKFSEYQAQLRTLQKEKADRVQKVLDYINEVHCLCGVLGLDFQKTVDEVHPSLHETSSGKSTNISNNTLEGLAQSILKLKAEKKARVQKLRETVESLLDLWKLMDSSEEEKRSFGRLKYILGSPEEEIKYNGVLSEETIEQTEAEVERLKKLKASRMKELVLKRRLDLEDICKRAHMEPDISTEPEKTNALIDSGLVDPSELVANIEAQIAKAKEVSISRKDIMDRISKWLSACEEENWLEEYNQDQNRYSSGRGSHLNLRRAEKARIAITKIPAMVDNLISRTFAWEDERNMSFLYDGVRLVSILEEYKLSRQQKEEERKRYRDQKKLQDLLEKGSMYGPKSIPKRSNSFNRKPNGYYGNGNGNGNGFMTPAPRRVSVGSATPELCTPRSYSGRDGYFRDTRRLSTASLNYVPMSKADTSSSFASISGSEPETPPLADFERKRPILEA
ncbi:65-kDa microtubule-associated protein 6-like [Iris pallida]|uniref:65-kDa microtubule-associated protein 6-like n=1 Tax=Iris pallida TaxID=29817 RepID=A0AAX6E9U8_IRIPA|nr:65-kDa microtubule-associated protein 6-like [Iris pallida]